ncbi:hypothetical protein F5B20DRAFT_298417 [Whalleya microplaca]|nr:hypothetical protein F5B20DRAFT_298417 [Whalleya microplaca]
MPIGFLRWLGDIYKNCRVRVCHRGFLYINTLPCAPSACLESELASICHPAPTSSAVAMVHPYLSGLMALVTLWLAVGTEANANHPRLFEHRQISHPYQNTSSSISPSHSSRHPTSSETLSHSNSTNTISITSRTSSSKSSISSSTSLKITSSPSSSSIPVTTPPSGTGVIVSQQTTTVNGKIQTHPVIVGGVFTSPVTLDSPDPTPLNPTGEPAKSSAKSISSSYSAVLGEITSWLENKDQAKATPILASLKGVLPEIGTMVNNLPNGKKSLSGGCKSAGKKRYLKSSPRVEGSIKETRKSSSSLKGAVTRFLRGQPIVQRDILGGLLGGLNKLLCSTTDLIDDFTKVTGTKDQGVINNLANGIKSTINGVDLGVVGGGGGGGDGGDGDGDNDDDNNTSTKSTDKTTTESSKKSSTSSSTASCTKSVTATFESIFCTVTASVSLPEIQRRQTACSSRVYKTVTGCSVSNSATRTTTIVAASKTPFSDTCSPETCGGTSCDSGKRDLEKRVYEDAPQRRIAPARGEWAEPANYGGDRSAFFRGEVARAYLGQGTDVGAVALNIKDTSQPTSSYTRRWTDEVATVAVAGLYGCTSVVVVSQRGVWATHMWENPSFTGAQLIAGFWYFDDYDLDVNGLPKYKYFEPIYEDENQKNQRFQREIIGAIHKGNGIDSWHSLGLDQLRNGQNSPVALLSHIFDTEAQPQVFIVTSRPRASTSDPNRHVDQNAGKRAYDRQIEEIREEIDDIFEEKAPIQVIDYYPITTPIDWPHNNDPSAVQSYQADSRGADVRGKIRE